MSSERKRFEERFEGLVSLFMNLARERRFSPLDRMARALDSDMVRTALYDAMRIAVSEGWPLPSQLEVADFLEEVERNPGVAQKLAVIAITAAPVAAEEVTMAAEPGQKGTQPEAEKSSQQAASGSAQSAASG